MRIVTLPERGNRPSAPARAASPDGDANGRMNAGADQATPAPTPTPGPAATPTPQAPESMPDTRRRDSASRSAAREDAAATRRLNELSLQAARQGQPLPLPRAPDPYRPDPYRPGTVPGASGGVVVPPAPAWPDSNGQ